tara:strand:- start:128129 stop:128509 length:381 start_codon:yes stop_codon:yes gene_type:complete
MIEFGDSDTSGDAVAKKTLHIVTECTAAAADKGLEIKFPEGTLSYVLTFNLRHLANEIDRIATLTPEGAAEHVASAKRISEGIEKLLDRVQGVDNANVEFDINTEEDLVDFYRREGLEPPDESGEV